MPQFRHSDLSPGNIHGIVQWSVATSVERDALVVTIEDIGKVCRVSEDLYWLSSANPVVWSQMGGGVTNLDGGSAASVYTLSQVYDCGGA